MKLLRYAVIAAAVAFPATVALAQPYQQRYFPPPFQGTVGPLEVLNSSPYPVEVTLWHPDNGEVWHRFTLLPSQVGVVPAGPGQPAILGDNWGLQLGNSPIKPLSRCAATKLGGPTGIIFLTTTDNFATH